MGIQPKMMDPDPDSMNLVPNTGCILTHLYLISRKESVELWKSRNETDAIGRLTKLNISGPSAAIPLVLLR
jgi:hypothetical protein